ncbi:uncharacterized protein [Typha latifolia]|uniref:uncharacterized protein n=1 Tax=Typha latifolia TaxID=4733 RepID=UPI003C2CD645
MGCFSSKILTKSGSFQENWNHSFQKITNVSDDVIISNSKSSRDQFLALLCTTSTVSKRIRAASFSEKPETNSNTNPSSTITTSPSVVEAAKIETINTWELLAGLEEEHHIEENQHKEKQVQQHQEPNDSASSLIKDESESGVGRVRSFRTVEDYDALVAAVNLESKVDRKDASLKHEGAIVATKSEQSTEKESKNPSSKISRRRSMAKELADLKVPSFDFSKSGSLREWLVHGGQVFSPGSYVTPKFGNLISEHRNRDQSNDHAVFDPEMVAQFEQAMKQLTLEEEDILKEIVETLEEGDEEDTARVELSEDITTVQN